MDKRNQFSLMMEALTEIIQEDSARLAPSASPKGTDDLPTLKSVLADIAPLPNEALYLGQADDGLPVLLNLYDPVPGPILISGDESSGKTSLLQTVASAADLLHPVSRVQYAIVTSKPDEWESFHDNQNNAGIYSTEDDNAGELLQSLVDWAHKNKGEESAILLFVDRLEDIVKLSEQAQQNLRWLLLRGTSRRVWCFVTLNAGNAKELMDWLSFFRTRLFGYVEDQNNAHLLTGNRDHTLDHLVAGTQFALRENEKLLNFWLPAID